MALVALFRGASTHLEVEVEDLNRRKTTGSIRWTARGTHRGEFQGIPTTNRTFTLSGISIDRIVEGKIVQSWAAYDRLHALEHFGIPVLNSQ